MYDRVKIKESKKTNKYLNLTRELKKEVTAEHDGDSDTNFDWCIWKDIQMP